MTINKFRSFLYALAKYLGDLQAVDRSIETGSPKPIAKRVGRRIAGKFTGRMLGNLFRW